MSMHFHVEGPNGRGIVRADMVRKTADSPFEDKSVTLEVVGQLRPINLLATDPVAGSKNSGFKFLGVKWT
jgi:hypothetical protein